ncbi:hypothetical protein ANN_21909 [Periplaneta americana]|uniref:Uncharacterized protein n=1 Tax=Periplaneta americana TaxID=6978 RepID=A0ABQ8S758_PERAM|nr:hypothetical protein ANN_21909 [Periplaneta americana]
MGAKTWILRRSEEKQLDAFEMWLWRRMDRVKWKDKIRNEAVLESVNEEIITLKQNSYLAFEWDEGDNAGEMNPGSSTDSYPVFARNGLRVNSGKNLNQRDEVTEEWRKLHNTELHTLYSSPDIIRNIKSRRLRWAGHVARIGGSINAYRVLVGRPEGKRPLGSPRRRWEDNIKMDSREVGYDDRDWINLAQDRDQWRAYVRAAMNLRHCVGEKHGHYGEVKEANRSISNVDMKKDGACEMDRQSASPKPRKETKMMMTEGKCRPNYDGEMSLRSNAESYPTILLRLVEAKPRKNLNQDFNPNSLISRSDVLTVTTQREPLKLAIGIPLLQSSADFDRTISSFTSVPGNVGDKVNEKTANILSKNPGYYQLKEIQDILEEKTPQKPTKFSIEQLTAFVQALLTSCDMIDEMREGRECWWKDRVKGVPREKLPVSLLYQSQIPSQPGPEVEPRPSGRKTSVLAQSNRAAEEAATAEFVKSEPAVVSLISVSSGRSVSSSGAKSSSTTHYGCLLILLSDLFSYERLARIFRKFVSHYEKKQREVVVHDPRSENEEILYPGVFGTQQQRFV